MNDGHLMPDKFSLINADGVKVDLLLIPLTGNYRVSDPLTGEVEIVGPKCAYHAWKTLPLAT